jgi:hypothetical protein
MYLQGLVLSVNECLFLPSARHQCTKSAYSYTPIKKADKQLGLSEMGEQIFTGGPSDSTSVTRKKSNKTQQAS